MTDLGVLDNKDYDESWPRTIRRSVRAVIFQQDRLAMVYVGKDDFYTFPGGKIENEETVAMTITRETREEVGLVIKPDSIKALATIKEVRKDLWIDGVFEQHDFFYTCEIDDGIVEQRLSPHEKETGYMLKVMAIDDVIATNKKALESGLYYLARELRVLDFLKNGLNNM